MTCVLIRRGQSHSGRRPSCDNGGRDWSDASASQGMPRAARKPQELEEEGRILPDRFPREQDAVHTLVSDFWPPQL